MDSENMKRVGLYLDKDLVKRADDMVKQFHFKSQNTLRTTPKRSQKGCFVTRSSLK